MSQQGSPKVEAPDPSSEGGTILSLLLENLGDPNPRVRVLAIREATDHTDEVVIDRVLASLQTIRDDIEKAESETLTKRLIQARRGYDEWWRQGLTSDWVGEAPQDYDAPTASEYYGQLLGIRRKKEED